uniref:LRRNT domain-containing protein n=1 Tax=Octopus bimaculoides TaxID=37653 RepID=A0A0L8HND6_OCTBM
MRHIFIIIFGYFLKILTSVIANCQTDCPVVCHCTEDKFQHCTVTCTDKNLTQIPSYFPENTISLDLSRNHIKRIPPDIIKHLNLLEVLKVDDNLLEYLLPNIFQGLWSLRELSLEYNRLAINYSSFPINLFRNLTEVKILKLRGNTVYGNTNFIDRTISHLTALEDLYISGGPFFMFGAGYKNLTKLKYINFASKRSNSVIRYITKDAFKNVPRITHLNLDYCHLDRFNAYTLSFFEHLHLLRISFNKQKLLKEIPRSLRHLKLPSEFQTLYFSNIKLNVGTGIVITERFTKSLQKTGLKKIVLNSNHIEILSWNSIPSLPSTLEYAYLRNNKFTYGEYIFQIKFLSNIKLIDISMTLSYRELPFIRSKLFIRDVTYSFTIPKTLKTLLLQGCQHKLPIPPLHIRDANAIRLINATNNLFCPWSGPVRGLEQLQILDLSHNQCNNISNEFFTFFTGLRLLNIENNAIGISGQVAEEGFSRTFLNLTNLKELYLSNNHIQYLSNNSLLQLKSLRILDLRNNLLESFDVKISHMLNLSYLDLSRNILQELSENTFNAIEKISEYHKLTVNIQNNKLKCGCAQIRFLTWLHKVRNSAHLKIMYSKCTYRNGTVWKLKGNQLVRIVSFLNHTCSALIGIIIAISFDIWLVFPVPGLQTHTLESGRYFVESKWCMFEYNLAKMEYIHTERNIVIIVVLEQVPHRQLPLPLLEQIKNQSYIEFPKENAIAQEMFWKNLKHSIQLKD